MDGDTGFAAVRLGRHNKQTNVTRYKLNRDCLTDPFVTGREKIKNVKSEQKAELIERERKLRMIYLLVDHFVEKRRKDEERLKEITENGNSSRDEEWELMMQESLQKFDMKNTETTPNSNAIRKVNINTNEMIPTKHHH
jgi:hypothetical protein